MSDHPPFHVYVLRAGDPYCIASCYEDSLGFTLRLLRDEDDIADGSAVGILERHEGEEHGRWLVNPWGKTTRSRHRVAGRPNRSKREPQ